MSNPPSQETPLIAEGMRQAGPLVSKLKFYSYGIVAANKPLKSKIVEVAPMEELPMLDGYLDDAQEKYTASGKDAAGKDYTTSVNMANSIKAEWIPCSASNRITPPDVRRGESLIIYQFGDADKFYWTTLKADNRLRKLETVIFAFSGTRVEDQDITAANSYFLEISTHTKQVTFHTSQADGEPYGYDIQINTKDGKIIIVDTIGNKFLLDSKAMQLRMENSVGAYMDLTKNIASIKTGEAINLESPKINMKGASQIILDTPDLRSP